MNPEAIEEWVAGRVLFFITSNYCSNVTSKQIINTIWGIQTLCPRGKGSE